MKRDDLIDFAFGGNKVRLFEYIAADILKKNADKIITFGSLHSNHVRVAAVVATRLGIQCDIIVLFEDSVDDNSIPPNLKLVSYCNNTHIEYCETRKAHDFIDEYLAEQNSLGINFYWIPGGGHTALAAQGYREAAIEILEQTHGINLDAMFLPCGTGTTQAGLINGLEHKVPVYGVTVARSIERCHNEIEYLLKQMTASAATNYEINVLPCEICYGEENSLLNTTILHLVQTDGIFLDPVYNAKSFLTMTQFISNHPELKDVVYINTGGSPNLF